MKTTELTLTPEIQGNLRRIPSLQSKVGRLFDALHEPNAFPELAYKAIVGEEIGNVPYWNEWALRLVKTFQNHATWEKFIEKLSLENKWDAMMGVLFMSEMLTEVNKRMRDERIAREDVTFGVHPQELQKRLEIAKQYGWLKSIKELEDAIAEKKRKYKKIATIVSNNLDYQVQLMMADAFSEPIPGGGQSLHASFKMTHEEGLDLNYQMKDGQVRKVFDRLGALQQIGVGGKQAQTRELAQKNLTHGNSLPDLVFEEYLQPDDLFDLAFIEEKLLQYKSGRSSVRDGMVVVCLDMSSSMNYNDTLMLSGDGKVRTTSYEVATKALVLRLYQIAVQQKRKMCCILFGTNILDVLEFDEVKMDEIVDRVLKRKANSGTNFTTAIDEALKLIEGGDMKASGQYKGADIIFITDGEDYVIRNDSTKKEISARKQRTRTKIRGVNIGRDIPLSFDYFCDEAIAIDFSNLQTLDKVVNL